LSFTVIVYTRNYVMLPGDVLLYTSIGLTLKLILTLKYRKVTTT